MVGRHFQTMDEIVSRKFSETIQQLKQLQDGERCAGVWRFHRRRPPADAEQLGSPLLPVFAPTKIDIYFVDPREVVKDKILRGRLSQMTNDTRRVPQLHAQAQVS
jgi:hypothetical protein